MGPDPFRTVAKLVWIVVYNKIVLYLHGPGESGPDWIGSAIWYQMGPLMKVILCGTVQFKFKTSPV